MTTSRTLTQARTSVRVIVPPSRAFEVFTSGIDQWWHRDHHLLGGTLAEVGIQPWEGGDLWERNDEAETCVWGKVLVWNPPGEFAFSWLIGPDWAVPAPDAPGSRVTLTFTPDAEGTLVELVHSELDVHGPGWEEEARAVGSARGWPGLLGLFGVVADQG